MTWDFYVIVIGSVVLALGVYWLGQFQKRSAEKRNQAGKPAASGK